MGAKASNSFGYSIDDLSGLVEGVPGWMSVRELWELFALVGESSVNDHAPILVEIGSWAGRSTITLAFALRSRGGGVLYSIDPHLGDPNYGIADTYPLLMANLRRTKLIDFVEIVRSTSRQAITQWGNQKVDMILHDGPRGYGDALEVFTDWEGTLVPGATVIVVDPFRPTVSQALKQTILGPKSAYRDPRVFRNLLIVRYEPACSWRFKDRAHRIGILARMQLWRYALAVLHWTPLPIRRMLLRALHRLRGE